MKENFKKVLLATAFIIGVWLIGCGSPTSQSGDASGPGKDYVLTGPGSYDSADTAVVTKINETDGQITFLNLKLNRKYTLNYDGTTGFSDKYGEALSLKQIAVGDIVDVKFLKEKKSLTSLQLSENAWVTENAERYTIDEQMKNITIGEDIFSFDENTRIFSEGVEIEMMEVNPKDTLSFQGIDTRIHSIVVEKGHGYLSLSGDKEFIGGWIEVGQDMIYPITEDMLLVVPEGNHEVYFSTAGGRGTKKITISRNQELVVDISDLVVEKPKFGQVVFVMDPADATLYVDGKLVDTSMPLSLQYGIHKMIAKAEGYETLTSYLKVGSASTGIEVKLEKEQKDVSSGDDEKEKDLSRFKIHVDGPEGVEVYFDGSYVGMAPVSIPKQEGSHVIVLRQIGYETRSYTVQIDGEEKDVHYTFSKLVSSKKEDEEDEKKPDVTSGNSKDVTSGNSKDVTSGDVSGDN